MRKLLILLGVSITILVIILVGGNKLIEKQTYYKSFKANSDYNSSDIIKNFPQYSVDYTPTAGEIKHLNIDNV